MPTKREMTDRCGMREGDCLCFRAKGHPGRHWCQQNGDAHEFGDAAPSAEPLMTNVCKFDGHPIYRLGEGTWLHYAEFKGDVFHDPEPALVSPLAEPAKAETCSFFGKINGWCLECGYTHWITAPQPVIDDAPAVERFKAEKHCCTVCAGKKLCHVCGEQTAMACSDCRIDLGATVYVCAKRACRDVHDTKCPGTRKDAINVTRI